jgi:hypothetical protein
MSPHIVTGAFKVTTVSSSSRISVTLRIKRKKKAITRFQRPCRKPNVVAQIQEVELFERSITFCHSK